MARMGRAAVYGGASRQKPARSRLHLGKLEARRLGLFGPQYAHSTMESHHIVGRLALTRGQRAYLIGTPLPPQFGSLFGKPSCHCQVPQFV
jgi:hypothetical protein